ncbi:TPA: helix-turn-helix transcriptional regulator [Bacillus cereus]|nr:helix-turn-helix transcriptional regulator [Bacillus cereus]
MRGDRVKQLRQEQNWTQDELGEKIGLKKSTISEIENNKKDASRKAITNLATVLECTADYLLGLSDHRILDSENSSTVKTELARIMQKIETMEPIEQTMILKMLQGVIKDD